MRSQLLVATLLGSVQASLIPRQLDSSLNSWIASEYERSLRGILDNTGPDGDLAPGAKPGVIIASPSTEDPNYFYTWARDSALTVKALVHELILNDRTDLIRTIDDYVRSAAVLQTVYNPSGGLDDGRGLGEPKFNVDETRFNDPWGRPQRDGPALQAITLMDYVKWLVENGQRSKAQEIVWPVIANDLAYTAQYWNLTGFDLWEEVDGSSFFTYQAQHRALVQAQDVSALIGEDCPGCAQVAPAILCFLESSAFWNGEYTISNINTYVQRSGLDANTMLAGIHNFDLEAECTGVVQPCASRQLSTFKRWADAMRAAYTINQGIPAGRGVALGRYTEDVYYGGNPWYLITFGAAEFLYDAVAQFRRQGRVTVDSTSLAFFTDIYPQAEARTYNTGQGCSGSVSCNAPFERIMRAMQAYADSFVAVGKQYTPASGDLAEQFSRETGAPISARDLTWSYSSVVTMTQRRNGQYPPSWVGSRGDDAAPTCAGTSVSGTYEPATATGAPDIYTGCTVPVTFYVNASTIFGQDIYVLGSVAALGNWVEGNAAPAFAQNYTAQRPLWYLEARLPPSTTIEYTYIRRELDKRTFTYSASNGTVVTGDCGTEGTATDDAFVDP